MRTRSALLTFALTISANRIAQAQTTPTTGPNHRPTASALVDSLHYRTPKFTDWGALAPINARGKLFVVTLAEPSRRQTCAVRSFTGDSVVCKRPFGAARTYRASEILALIVPGDHDFRIRALLGFNAGLGVSIWATVILAATCPACAVGTGIAALFCFGAAGAIGIGDGQPDAVFFLAPGQTLRVELRY
jgi:hypothetical protein